jgi:RNA polymerase sigma-70 factor (ECF subfamily)
MTPIRSDAQLIDQFLTGGKDDSESAFEALVKLHGPMVLGVCRQVLRREQDAEDAFQATFLALARKAGTIRDRQLLASWLHAAAFRIALRARRSRFREQTVLPQVKETQPGPVSEANRNELQLLVRAEVDDLPANYRSLILHSYIEGKTNEQVARLLRRPIGTVKGQLSRARGLLRARLSRRGWDADEVRYRWG